MAKSAIGVGSSANDGTGDDLRSGAIKINANFDEIYGALGTGTSLSTGISATASVVTLTAPVIATSLDMNGGELILDADADTSITADTDDTIHVKIGGNDRITMSTGLIDIKNDGAQSELRMYCESSNAHYAALQAPAHADFSGNITITMPSTTDTLVGRATTDTLTNKTLTSPTITGTGAIAGTFTGNITGNVTGNVTGNIDGIVGGNTPAAVTGTSISGTSITVTGTLGTLTLNTVTTTQRNALSASNGMVVYNSTDSKIQAYSGGAWVDLH